MAARGRAPRPLVQSSPCSASTSRSPTPICCSRRGSAGCRGHPGRHPRRRPRRCRCSSSPPVPLRTRADPEAVRPAPARSATGPGRVAVPRRQHEAGPGPHGHRDGPVQGADRRRSLRQHGRPGPAAVAGREARTGEGLEARPRHRRRFDARWLDQGSPQRPVHPGRQGPLRPGSSRRWTASLATRSPSACSTPDGANVLKAIGDKHLLDVDPVHAGDRRPAARVGQAQARPRRVERQAQRATRSPT